MRGTESGRSRRAAALLSLVALGAALRLYGLDAESLWNDELTAWSQSSSALSLHEVLEHVRHDVHPPGYLVVLHLVQTVFGDSELALRAPSAIAGVLSIVLMYLVGSRFYCRSVGLVAAAVLAVSWNPIYYSQEARAYGLLMLLVLASVHQAGRVLARLDGPPWPLLGATALYVLCAASACYVHYFGLLFVGLLGIALLCLQNRRARNVFAGAHALVALLYAPWVPSMLEQMAKDRSGFWLQEPRLLGSLGGLFFFSFRVPWLFGLLAIAPLFVLFAVSVFSTLRALRMTRSPPPKILFSDLLVLAWSAAPFLAAYALSHLLTPILTFRNLIVVTPALYLMLARALSLLPQPPARASWTLLVLVGIVFGLIRGDFYGSTKKEQFREAARYVVEHDDSLPVVAHTFGKHQFDYYFERLGSPARVALLAGTGPDDVAAVTSLVRERGAPAFWFVTGHREPDLEFLAALRRVFRLRLHAQYQRASASLYCVKRAAGDRLTISPPARAPVVGMASFGRLALSPDGPRLVCESRAEGRR